MTRADDMVFAPSLGPKQTASARARARTDRRQAAAEKRGGTLHRLRQLRAARRAKRAVQTARANKRAAKLASKGARALGRGAASRLAGRAAGTPVGLIIMGLVLAGVVTTRLITGKPLEGLGQEMNDMILGDYDDEARAKMEVRRRFQADDELSGIAGHDNAVNPQLMALHKDLLREEKQYQVGVSALKGAMPINNEFDMLILRVRDAIVSAWKGDNGPNRVEQAMDRIAALFGMDGGEKAGR